VRHWADWAFAAAIVVTLILGNRYMNPYRGSREPCGAGVERGHDANS
jgi:hypothetical protein